MINKGTMLQYHALAQESSDVILKTQCNLNILYHSLKCLISKYMISSFVVGLGGTGQITIAEYESSGSREPTLQELGSVSDYVSLVVADLLERVPLSILGSVVPNSSYIRIKSRRGTLLHCDIPFYAKELAKGRKICTGSCCFCGLEGQSPTCQRCTGGGLSTVWMPLHDTKKFLKMRNWSSEKYNRTEMKAGDLILFDGSQEHFADDAAEEGFRISIDLRFCANFLSRIQLHDPLQDEVLLEECRRLLSTDLRLFKMEAFNTSYLFSYLDTSEIIATHRTQPNHCPIGVSSNIGCLPLPLDTNQLVDSWFYSKHPTQTVLSAIRHASSLCNEKIILLTIDGYIKRKDEKFIYFITHAIFIATDFLLSPWSWNLHGTNEQRSKIEVFVVNLYTMLEQNKFGKNFELFIEVASCAHRLGLISFPLNLMTSFTHLDIYTIIRSEITRYKKGRYASDVTLHSVYLWVWFKALLNSERKSLTKH